MARGDAIDDAAFDHLVGDLAVGPVGDGSSRLAGGLTGHGHDGADLLSRDPGPRARTRGIAEAILDTELGQGDGLKEPPAFPPESDRVEADLERVGDSRIAQPVRGVQDDLSPQDHLLRSGVSTDKGLEGGALRVSQFDGRRLGATHDRLRRQQDAGSRQIW